MLNNLFVVLQFPYQKDEYGLQAETDDVTIIRPFRIGRVYQVDTVQYPEYEQHETENIAGGPARARHQETDARQNLRDTGQGIQHGAGGPAGRYEPDKYIRAREMQDTRQDKNRTEEPNAYIFHDHKITGYKNKRASCETLLSSSTKHLNL